MSNPSLREGVRPRKSGEEFNPWRKACGFSPSDIVGRQRDLGNGPKRLYERLVRWAGQNGSCWYSYARMAVELGKCVRQVKSDMATLERYGLIRHQRRGKRLANRYTFLWHPVFDSADVHSPAPHRADTPFSSEMQADAHHQHQTDGHFSASDGRIPAPGVVQSAAHEFCNQNSVKGNPSSSQADAAEHLTAPRADDDGPSLDKGLNGTVRECLLAFVQASGIQMPTGPIPTSEVAAGLASIGATVADLVGFLKDYAGHWRDAPATWRHVLVSFQHWASDPRTLGNIESLRKRKEKTETPPTPHVCGRCNGRGFFATTWPERLDGEEVLVLTAYACFCPTGRLLTEEQRQAKEDELVAKYRAHSSRAVARHRWPNARPYKDPYRDTAA